MSGLKFLKVGDQAPSFTALDQDGNKISSSDFKGKKWVIYFYPKDQTPGCIAQACNIRDNYQTLLDKKISIIGVSGDSQKSHLNFIEKQQIPFPLIADEDKVVIQSFGVWGEKKFMGKIYDGIHRTTFLIDENNIIQGIINKPKTKAHVEEILEIF
ncbi:thioredoxin-dependent thiol peroxidase [Crocinitomicaceae bacterium]|jgi:thioredoxin-dependent peroxiredoxin|nr:thioredoxin-dependent thiol peroxidase [Crocinitomicaceae bacterium]